MARSRPDRPVVSPAELFFDLVFGLALTQLTGVLASDPTWTGLARVLIMILLVWWMYDGYAWLTNEVTPDRGSRQAVLLAGMGAFLLLSLSMPGAFSAGGGAFGLAYLIIVALHLGMFSRASSTTVVNAILHIAPSNVAAALLVLGGGIAGGTVQYVTWAAAALLEWATPFVVDDSGFEVEAVHFVERHRVVVLVAIGEAVVAAGYGVSRHPLGVALGVCALLGLATSGGLWWAYFGHDDGSVEEAVVSTPDRQRPHRVLMAFGIWHLPLLLGVVIESSGLRRAVAAPSDILPAGPAVALAAGIAVYLVGEALFRRNLGLTIRWPRLLVAVMAFGAIPLGLSVSATAEAGAVACLLVAGLASEGLVDRRARYRL
jgi:low temperature requirement protein LtrA